jgi:hypothetical protein
MFITFPVQPLTEKFILPLVNLRGAGVVLVNQEGQVISSNYRLLFDKNIFELVEQYDLDTNAELLTAFKQAKTGIEGGIVHQAPDLEGQGKTLVISAFAPLNFNQANWFLWISFPVEKAMADSLPLLSLRIWTLVLDIFGLLLLSLSVIVGFRLAQKKAFIEGFDKARRELIKSVKGN